MNKTWDPTHFGDVTDDTVKGFWLDGRYFPIIRGGAENDDGAGDGDGSTEGDSSDGTSTDKDDSKGDDDKGGDDEKTLTQKQVDEIVSREKAKAARGKIDPKDLGFKDLKEAKDFMETMKKKAEEDKSEGEKALEDAIKEAKAEATAAVLDKANERLTRAEFKLAAGSHDVAYLDDAYEIAQKLDIWDGVEISDEGEVSGFDDDFFEELEKAKPYLFKQAGEDDDKGSDIGAGRRKSTTKPDREAELKEKFPALQANG